MSQNITYDKEFSSEDAYLSGEDYSILVQVWDNEEDDIYDTAWFTASDDQNEIRP